MAVDYEVHKKKFSDSVFKKLKGNAHLTGLHLAGKVIELISQDQPVKRTVGKDGSVRLVSTTPATKGAPPRVLYGKLRESIDYEVHSTKSGGGKVVIVVGAGMEYAATLEKGHPRSGVKHPFMVPTLKKETDNVIRKLAQGLV